MDYKEKVIALLKSQELSKEQKEKLENIFPELKESEDERIRKELIDYHRSMAAQADDYVHEAWIAWLEKQGEQMSEDENAPKFKVGDWITNGDYTWKIVEVEPLDYVLQSQNGNIVDDTINHVDEQFHSFTIEDAKDGDVLSDGTTIFIFKDLLSDGSVMSYCDYDTDSGESDAFCPLSVNLMCSKITPATKEQRDTLFAKMHEAGYMLDSESKQLLSLKAGPSVEQKPAWSEKDEQHIDSLLKRLDGLCRNEFERTRFAISEDKDWLKSLKQRIEGE